MFLLGAGAAFIPEHADLGQAALENFDADRLNRVQTKSLVQGLFSSGFVEGQASIQPFSAQRLQAGVGNGQSLWGSNARLAGLGQWVARSGLQLPPQVNGAGNRKALVLARNQPFN